nr:PAS domain S-box protein [uncultured Desulfobulbus sp.]
MFKLSVSSLYYLPPAGVGAFLGLLLVAYMKRNQLYNEEVTEQNLQLNRKTQEGEERYRRLFQQSQAAQLVIHPLTGLIIGSNEAAQSLYGYNEGQLGAMSIYDINVDARRTTIKNMQRVLSGEQLNFQFHHRVASGDEIPVAVYTVPLPQGEETLLHSVIIDLSSQDRAESHLRRKTLEQRLLLDSIPVSVWYLKDAETYGSVNLAFAENFGLTPLDIAHHPLEAVLRPRMLALALASNRQVFAGKKALHYEQWFTFSNDNPRYMAITKTPKLDEQGEVEFVVCTATDITTMQQARELLRIERNLHVALTAANSFEETLELCLKKAMEISQTDCGGLYQLLPEDEGLHLMVQQGLPASLIAKEAVYEADSAYTRLVLKNKPVYTSFDRLNKQLAHATHFSDELKAMAIIPITFEGKTIAALHVASHELDEISGYSRAALERIVAHLGTFLMQKQQAAQILRSQRNLESLFNTIHDMVFILDMQGRIRYLNASAIKHLGYQTAELIGKSIISLHPEKYQKEAEELCAEILAGTNNFCPFPLMTKTGDEIPVETHLTLGQWSGKKVVFGLSRDIGGRLQLEQQQRQLMKHVGMERMAGAIAHHFNNLMAIVAGNLELALEQSDIRPETFNFLRSALDGSQRATDLGKSLLLYTGHFAEKNEQLNLSEICRKQVNNVRQNLPENILLSEEYPPQDPVVIANPQQLTRVLDALITNAVEGIGTQPGQLCLRVSSLKEPAITNRHINPAGWKPEQITYACLELSDNGGGINAEQLENIFDPFYSDKFIGRGLGLPLALSIVKKLGGAISVQSSPNQGSVFKVLLPEVNRSFISSL